MDKLVSVIITTQNRLNLLKRAIKSVNEQTYKHIECIIVSDGGEDNTIEYCKKQPNITFIHIDKKDSKGANYARNIGITHSHGSHIAFLDDDDYWLPTKIELQMNGLEQHPECLFSISNCIYESENNDGTTEVSIADPMPQTIIANVKDYSIYSLIILKTFTSTLLVEKNYLLEIGGWDENLRMHQDRELLIRLSQHSKVYAIDTPLWIYRIGNKNRKASVSMKYELLNSSHQYILRKHQKLNSKLSFKQKLQRNYNFLWLKLYISSVAGKTISSFYHKCLLFIYRILFRIMNISLI